MVVTEVGVYVLPTGMSRYMPTMEEPNAEARRRQVGEFSVRWAHMSPDVWSARIGAITAKCRNMNDIGLLADILCERARPLIPAPTCDLCAEEHRSVNSAGTVCRRSVIAHRAVR